MFIFSIRWDCFQERHVRQVFTRHAFLFRDTYNIGATVFVEVAVGDVGVTFLEFLPLNCSVTLLSFNVQYSELANDVRK